MIATIVALAIGTALGWVAWQVAGDMFRVDALMRSNYRDRSIPTSVGMLIPVCMLGVVALVVLWQAAASTAPRWASLAISSVVAAFAFGALGLLDDVAGTGQSGGFRGHLRAAAEGRATSGLVKFLGGAALSVMIAAMMHDRGGVGSILRDGAIIALSANLLNLFDRAPGRSTKVGVVLFVVTALVARNSSLAGPAIGVGAALGLLVPDLRERCMLGDAGSNALGGLCGIALLVAAPSTAAAWTVLVVLLVANAASEIVSFSQVIDSFGPLRWLDRAGSLRDR